MQAWSRHGYAWLQFYYLDFNHHYCKPSAFYVVQLIFDPDHNKMIKDRSVTIIKLERVGASLRNEKFVASTRPLAAPLYTLYIPVVRRHSSDF